MTIKHLLNRGGSGDLEEETLAEQELKLNRLLSDRELRGLLKGFK